MHQSHHVTTLATEPDEEDIFTDTSETEEIIILQLSHNPISVALHPLKETMMTCNNIIAQLQISGHRFGHVNGGSMATTTDKLDLLTDVVPIQNGPKLQVADARAHTLTHRGTMKIKLHDKDKHVKIQCFYTPTLPVTIISPCSVVKQIKGTGYLAHANLSGKDCYVTIHARNTRNDLQIPCSIHGGLLFAEIEHPSTTTSTPHLPLHNEDIVEDDNSTDVGEDTQLCHKLSN